MQIDPELGKAAFSLSLFVVLLAGGLTLFEPHDTAQFAISVITLGIGLLFLGTVVLVVRVFSR